LIVEQRSNEEYTIHSNTNNTDTGNAVKKENNRLISQFGSVKWNQKQEGQKIKHLSENQSDNQ